MHRVHMRRSVRPDGQDSSAERAREATREASRAQREENGSATVEQEASVPHRSDGEPRRIRLAVIVGEQHRLLAHALAISVDLDASVHVVTVDVGTDVDEPSVAELAPDVALVDDVTYAAAVRRARPSTAVLVLEASHNPATISECVQAGAVGCITPRTSPGTVIDAIKAVYYGEILFPHRILLELAAQPRPKAPAAIRRTAALAPREIQVLQTLAQCFSAGRSAERLNISINTLRTHLKNALTKLEAESTLEAVLIALREGRIELPP